MGPQIDFSSIGKFFLSLGLIIVFLPLFLINADWNVSNSLPMIKVLYFVLGSIGLIFVVVGLVKFIKDISMEESYKIELKINNILDQDLKFMELKIKTFEYNRAVEEYNNTHKGKLGTLEHRNFESVAKQAMDSEYYNNTYGLYKVIKKK